MKKRNTGWWIDERIPGTLEEFAKLLPPTIDALELSEWLREQLIKYRSAIATRDAIPSRAQEIAGARRLVASRDETLAALRDLPLRAMATLRSAGVGGDERIGRELAHRLERDLTLMRVLALSTAMLFEATSVKRGRRKSTPRDELLSAIVRRLRDDKVPVQKARTIAAALLTYCEIKFDAADERSIRRAANRGGQKREM